MRLPAKIIKEEGERVTPHSKFYIWNNMLWESATYRGKPSKTFKVITDVDRMDKILNNRRWQVIPTVSSICPSISNKINNSLPKTTRFDLLDLRNEK